MILVVRALPEELPGFAPDDGIELLSCGIGPVEAAASVARALAARRYDAVINAGIAGVFRKPANALSVGDACVVVEERLAELGWEDGVEPALPGGATLARRVEASPELARYAGALPYPLARGLTVIRVTTTRATEERLRTTYDADIETMEGFAVLRAARLAGVPAIGVRGISNRIGPRAEGGWDLRAGAHAAVGALRALLESVRS